MTASELSSSFDKWVGIAEIGCFIVIVGIFVELADVITKAEKIPKFSAWFDNRLNPALLDNFAAFMRGKELWAEFISVFLVAGGLIIEFGASHVAYGISDLENATLNQKAADAWVLAENASRTNAQLVASNLALKKELDEEEQYSALTIRMKLIRPRWFLFDEKKFIADLAGRPKGSVSVFVTSGNKADSILALKIENALTNAGWTVIPSAPVTDDLLVKRPDFAVGNQLLVKKMADFKTDWIVPAKINPDGTISMTNLWRMDTPERTFKVALGDSGLWIGMESENPGLSEGSMQLILGIEQW